jgi:hypothetical protein
VLGVLSQVKARTIRTAHTLHPSLKLKFFIH